MKHQTSGRKSSTDTVRRPDMHDESPPNTLTRSEELLLGLIINLGNYYIGINDKHKAAILPADSNNETLPREPIIELDNTAGTVIELQGLLADYQDLIKVVESHWSIDLSISPIPRAAIFDLCGHNINESLIVDVKQASGCSEAIAKSKLDELAFSYALLSRFLPASTDDTGQIAYSYTEYKDQRSEYRRYFARLLESVKDAKNRLTEANTGWLINKTAEVVDQDDNYSSPRNIIIIAKHIESSFLGVQDNSEDVSVEQNYSDRVSGLCAGTAIETFVAVMSKFNYRYANNRPDHIDHPFLAYADAWIRPEIKKTLVSARTDEVILEPLPDEGFSADSDDLTYPDHYGRYQKSLVPATEPQNDETELAAGQETKRRILGSQIKRLTQTEQKLAHLKYERGLSLSEISPILKLSIQQLSNLSLLIEFKFRRYFGTSMDPVEWFQSIPIEIMARIPQEERDMLSYRCNQSYGYAQIATEVNRKYKTSQWNRRNVATRVQAWDAYIRRTTSSGT